MLERRANREVENWPWDQVATFTFLWLYALKKKLINQKAQKRGMKEVSQILSCLNEMKAIQG